MDGAAGDRSDCDGEGHTALHLAVACCSSKIVEKLLMMGWDVNALDHLGQSPLHVSAIRYGLPETRGFCIAIR